MGTNIKKILGEEANDMLTVVCASPRFFCLMAFLRDCYLGNLVAGFDDVEAGSEGYACVGAPCERGYDLAVGSIGCGFLPCFGSFAQKCPIFGRNIYAVRQAHWCLIIK